MMGLLQKLSLGAKNRTTYRAGLLQAKAYRILKQETAKILKPFDITTFEWGFLGLLADHEAIRPKHLAEELGVEAPFVTQILQRLKKKGLVAETRDPKDTRAKTLSLTAKGETFISKIEPVVRSGVKPLLEGAGMSELLGYLAVLETIIRNGTEKTQTERVGI